MRLFHSLERGRTQNRIPLLLTAFRAWLLETVMLLPGIRQVPAMKR
jgi:hypothetical protein